MIENKCGLIGIALDPKPKCFISTENIFCAFMHFGLELKSILASLLGVRI